MKVLLVANYQGDRQWSMERFCKMLEHGLWEEGIETRVVRPSVILGAGNKWLGYIDKFLLFRFALRRAIKRHPGWVVHIIDQGNGIYAGWTTGCAVTCHDLLAIRAACGELAGVRTGLAGRIFQHWILRGLRKAAGIACVSEATRKDADRLVGQCEMIPNGLEDFWKPTHEEEAWSLIEKAGVSARSSGYLLHVGGDQWYKNRAGVVRLFIDLRARTGHSPKLVMVGPELEPERITELKNTGLQNEVAVVRSIPDETLRALYGMARLFLFPSLAEGFGWPVVEAQACGCPVVASEALRHTAGDAAVYPGAGEWPEAIAELLDLDPARRAAMVAAGRENAARFTVRRMAREYVEFYRRHPH